MFVGCESNFHRPEVLVILPPVLATRLVPGEPETGDAASHSEATDLRPALTQGTWWIIPRIVSRWYPQWFHWDLCRVSPLITGDITYLLSGMIHQVRWSLLGVIPSNPLLKVYHWLATWGVKKSMKYWLASWLGSYSYCLIFLLKVSWDDDTSSLWQSHDDCNLINDISSKWIMTNYTSGCKKVWIRLVVWNIFDFFVYWE